MIAPLAVRYADEMGLSSSQKSMIIATPVLVGSLGRIIAGALTDRFGGRLMFTVLLWRRRRACCWCRRGNRDSYGLMLLSWPVPRHRRHDVRGRHPVRERLVRGRPARPGHGHLRRRHGWHGALGVLHATVRELVRLHDHPRDHRRRAGRRALLVWFAMRDSPLWNPTPTRSSPKLAAASKLAVTWQMAFLYAVAFGGFVAFSTYLPTYLKDVYDFGLTGAGTEPPASPWLP